MRNGTNPGFGLLKGHHQVAEFIGSISHSLLSISKLIIEDAEIQIQTLTSGVVCSRARLGVFLGTPFRVALQGSQIEATQGSPIERRGSVFALQVMTTASMESPPPISSRLKAI